MMIVSLQNVPKNFPENVRKISKNYENVNIH